MSKASKNAVVETTTPAAAEERKPLANVNGHYVFDDTRLAWTTQSNPKRPSGKAHARFAAYMGKSTVAEYLEAGGTMADLKYDNMKGYINFDVAEAPAAE